MRRARARFTALKGFEPGLDILNVKEHGGVEHGYRLADLIYADDTTLMARPEHIQTWLDCLGLEARAVGLEISVKTEAMVIGASSTPPLPRLLDGTTVPFRDRFKLLGSWLPDTADDVDTRIGLAWARLRSLNTYWRSKGLGEHRKRMLFKVLVLTVLTYGAEAWTLTPTLAARLDSTVYRMLRQVLNVGFSKRPSSESLYQGMPRISDEIRQRRIAFVGHLARTSQVDTALGLAGPQRLGQPGRHILTWPGPKGIAKKVGNMSRTTYRCCWMTYWSQPSLNTASTLSPFFGLPMCKTRRGGRRLSRLTRPTLWASHLPPRGGGVLMSILGS
eukprot:jgi/Mesvir1/16391/Mv25727-RA.1